MQYNTNISYFNVPKGLKENRPALRCFNAGLKIYMILTPKSRTGMTLMEILVVLVIIAMGWFAFMPSLDVGGRFRGADRLKGLNEFMETVRTAAFRECAIQKIQVVLGDDFLAWGEEKISLPGGVSRCLINGESPGGLAFDFQMYPAGVMDEVRLVLLNGMVLEGGVLSGRLEL